MITTTQKRALCVKLSQGTKTLLMVARFNDKAAAQTAIRHDVSVGTDKDVVDGLHNEYDGNVLLHVALTSIPVIPGLGGWNFVKQDNTGIYYSKEILPVGEYYKESDDTTYSFSERVIDELVNNFDLFTEGGNKVPVQLTHDDDGDKLGDVVSLEVANRSPANLSGRQRKKKKASRLLALSQGTIKMNPLDEILATLGAEVAPDMDDAAKLAMIMETITALQTAAESTDMADEETDEDEVKVPMSQQPTGDVGGAAGALQAAAGIANGQTPSQVSVKFSQKDCPAVAISATAQGYKNILASHVESGVITPAQKDAMERIHCNPKTLRVHMSRAMNNSRYKADEDFQNALKVLLAGNKQWTATGRSDVDPNSAQTAAAMSRGVQQSPLLAARERAKERKQNIYR